MGVSVDQFGQFLYVANNLGGSVSAFDINPATGVPGPLIGVFPVGGAPVGATVDQSGRFLYVADSGTNNVWADLINPAIGILPNSPGTPFPTGAFPVAVATTP
jgi:DNA-binding beta-propeller fold protein YncE